MTPTPIITLQPPPPRPTQVLHIDRFGVEMPRLEPSYGRPIVGHIEARGASHPVPAVVVRKGTL